MINRALISVSDKTGIVPFAQFLEQHQIEILSTGGTAALLRENGVQVRDVSDFTGFPEVFEGRVKTLHPKVHGGLLYIRGHDKHEKMALENDILPIDLVVVNLYPFEDTIAQADVTLADAIENIDIGGPSLLRSAAKNFESVTVITNPEDYTAVQQEIAQNGVTTLETRRKLAAEVFVRTAEYDAAIAGYFHPDFFMLNGRKIQDLRYGENPHQSATFYRAKNEVRPSLATATKLQGKELSFNNILDANAALSLILEFAQDAPAATVFKHLNPCGTARADSIEEAFDRAYQADSLSAFGGIVALNRPVSAALAQKLTEMFLEIVIAPEFSEEAQQILASKKNLRLLEVGAMKSLQGVQDVRSVLGGFLVQDLDVQQIHQKDLQFVTKAAPTEQQIGDLLFAAKICRNVRSNAIVLAKEGRTVGVGAGQMSRVDAVDIAVKKGGAQVKGCVAASDAFFPFPDGVEALAAAGVSAVLHPGGSRKDEEVIARANELNIAMVCSGIRAFRH